MFYQSLLLTQDYELIVKQIKRYCDEHGISVAFFLLFFNYG